MATLFWETFTSLGWKTFTAEEWEIFLGAAPKLAVFDINTPAIVSPNGGENIFSRSLDIRWQVPSAPNDNGLPVFYEIYFTPEWEPDGSANWVQIATAPSSITHYVWKIPFPIHSDRCRIAIRGRDPRGFAARIVISASNFTIRPKFLSSPVIVSPIDGDTYHQYVPIAIDYKSVLGTYSQRATYQIFYSSESLGKDWTTIRQNVPVRSAPFLWDTRDLPAAKDYKIKVVLMDDDENSSIPAYVENLSITSLDYFVIDTTPPKGKITAILDNDYTSNRNIVFRVSAFDEATGVKSVVLRENFGTQSPIAGSEQEMSDIKTWYISSAEDGVRYIEALFKDFGDNTPESLTSTEFFRQYISDDDLKITAFLLIRNADDVITYTAFGGTTPVLFRNKSSYLALPEDCTSLAVYNGAIYVATKDANNRATLYRIVDDALAKVFDFKSTSNSAITCMYASAKWLYLNQDNGGMYYFDGITVTAMTSLPNGAQPRSIFADGVVALVGADDTTQIYAYPESNLQRMSASVVNGNIQF